MGIKGITHNQYRALRSGEISLDWACTGCLRQLERDFIDAENFLVDDINTMGARHLFATSEQLQHLARARRWFIDGTFRVVSRPFHQLMTIHAFVKKGDDIKQVPLLFVLMSRRQKRDYVAVFQAIIQRFQPEELSVEWVMIDYEAAAWQAIRQVFTRVLIRGCVFHWTQRIYRMVIRVGLSASYTEGGDIYTFIRKILALPFLPSEHISGAFADLKTLAAQAPTPEMERLLAYIQTTGINGALWRPENWSVFRETVRTNNDVEGWHRGLNSRANGSKLPMYVLIPLLQTEAADVNITIRLVSDNLLTRNQRTKYKKTHGRLFDIWDHYEEEDQYTTSKLLREASHLQGLGPIPATAEDHGEDDDGDDN